MPRGAVILAGDSRVCAQHDLHRQPIVIKAAEEFRKKIAAAQLCRRQRGPAPSIGSGSCGAR